ncbi:hypothetical protein C8R45DRAFT_1084101 [Mycena sanguinolenta]|nr:hypothetical protein C8R45DRAFT_1084101 [Mycena sanguinolenta]
MKKAENPSNRETIMGAIKLVRPASGKARYRAVGRKEVEQMMKGSKSFQLSQACWSTNMIYTKPTISNFGVGTIGKEIQMKEVSGSDLYGENLPRLESLAGLGVFEPKLLNAASAAGSLALLSFAGEKRKKQYQAGQNELHLFVGLWGTALSSLPGDYAAVHVPVVSLNKLGLVVSEIRSLVVWQHGVVVGYGTCRLKILAKHATGRSIWLRGFTGINCMIWTGPSGDMMMSRIIIEEVMGVIEVANGTEVDVEGQRQTRGRVSFMGDSGSGSRSWVVGWTKGNGSVKYCQGLSQHRSNIPEESKNDAWGRVSRQKKIQSRPRTRSYGSPEVTESFIFIEHSESPEGSTRTPEAEDEGAGIPAAKI